MPKKKQTDDTDTLNAVLKDFQASWDYTSSAWHGRWKDNHDLYNNNRVKRGYEGITDTFVPMAFSTVETIVSALFGTKPKIEYIPPANKGDQKTDTLNALYDHFYEKDQWSVKNVHIGRSFAKLGTGIAYYYWEYDHPCKIVIPVRDFFIDPTASDLETARFMGRRYLTTKARLEEYEVIDLENPVQTPVLDDMGQWTGEFETSYNMKKKYKNLDQVHSQGSKGDTTDKQEKDMWYGSTFDNPEDNEIEVIEWWTLDKTISVANRSVVIEDTDNYFKQKAKQNGEQYPKGIMPFAAARNYVDESLFWAKGEVDIIADQQELLNDITNQNIDSVTYALNQMYTLDPAYGDLITEIENLPGAVYPVPNGALMPIQQRPIPAEAFTERMNIKNEIRETTASSEVVKGVGEQQGGKATATEINAQVMGSGQRINLKVTQLENEFFHREARIIFQMCKLYITEPLLVRILGRDGASYEWYDPNEYQDDYEPRAQLDISVQAKKKEEADKAKEMYAAFMGDPEINQQELKKLVLQRGFDLDPDEVQTLLQPMPMMGMPVMEGMPPDPAMGMPAQMQPPMDPMAMQQPMPEGAMV